MSQSDRAHDRVDVGSHIDAIFCHDGAEPSISVMNLSPGGAALMADEPIGSVPQRAELRMRLREDGDWVTCPCELRYILGENRPGGEPAWLHGVLFLDISEQARAFIAHVATRRAHGAS